MTDLPVLSPILQMSFYQRLQEAKKAHLLPALLETVGSLEIGQIDHELLDLAGNDKLSFVAQRGIRGELVFPVPYILTAKPALLGYYRLLLGFSQKEFYKSPFGRFKRMEVNGDLTQATKALIVPLCHSLIESSWMLVNGLPELSVDTLKELTLLTLGPQLRGSRNVDLGAQAIKMVFALIRELVIDNIQEQGQTFLQVASASDRTYRIEFAPDPDIAIRQQLADGSYRNRIAIEIKGGTDFSNAHNRLGEAEKSHQKAKADGFTQFWTVINVSGIDVLVWKRESPTTNELFHLTEILDERSSEHSKFREYLVSELGI